MTDRFKEVADSLNKYKPHLSGMGGSIGTAELGVFTRNHINILTEALYLAQDNEDSAVRYYKVCLELAEKRIESEQLRKENEELKAKLDKAIKAVEVPSDMVDADLMFCLQKFDNIPYKTVQEIARATADIIAQRARTTLEEI